MRGAAVEPAIARRPTMLGLAVTLSAGFFALAGHLLAAGGWASWERLRLAGLRANAPWRGPATATATATATGRIGVGVRLRQGDPRRVLPVPRGRH